MVSSEEGLVVVTRRGQDGGFWEVGNILFPDLHVYFVTTQSHTLQI